MSPNLLQYQQVYKGKGWIELGNWLGANTIAAGREDYRLFVGWGYGLNGGH